MQTGEGRAGNPVETEPPTFQERYQSKMGIGADEFVSHLLRHALFPHARLLQPFLPASVFVADRDFIANVGRIRTRRDLSGECNDFLSDLRQESVWKRWLRLRVSTVKLREIASNIW